MSTSVGTWRKGTFVPAFTQGDLAQAVPFVREPIHIVQEPASGRLGLARGGDVIPDAQVNGVPTYPLVGVLPSLFPEWLGDRAFLEAHRVRFPYVTGAMANGIATTDLVIAMARAGMMGFFGAAGLTVDRIAEGLDRIFTAGFGLEDPFGNAGDMFGLGVGWADPDARSLRDEYVVEAFYRVQVTPTLQFTPDFQVVFQPSASTDDAVGVFSLRFRIQY